MSPDEWAEFVHVGAMFLGITDEQAGELPASMILSAVELWQRDEEGEF